MKAALVHLCPLTGQTVEIVASFSSPWKALEYAAAEFRGGSFSVCYVGREYEFRIESTDDEPGGWRMDAATWGELTAACPRKV